MTGETPQERREAAATRRRWVTLAEVVAVAGVVIAALTLYLGWSDRRADDAEKRAEQTSEARDKARLDLKATVSGGDITLADDAHEIQEAKVAFPTALGVGPLSPSGDIAIPADAVADAMRKLTDGGADDRTGRLPVLVTARYWDGDTVRSSTAIYDLAWRTEGRALRGRSFRFDGARLRQRGGDQRALDAVWTRVKP